MNINNSILKRIALFATMILMVAALVACAASDNTEPTGNEIQTEETESVAVEVVEEVTEEPEVEQETEEQTIPEVEAPEAGSIGYAEYLELTVEEQQAYYENFESADDFFVWLNDAQVEDEATTTPTETHSSGLNVEIVGNEEWE